MKLIIVLMIFLQPIVVQSQYYYDTVCVLSHNEDTTEYVTKAIAADIGVIQYINFNDSLGVFVFNHNTLQSLSVKVKDLWVDGDFNAYYSKDLEHKIVVNVRTMDTWLYYDYDPLTRKYLEVILFISKKRIRNYE